jgi:hypothetical protein
MLWLECEQFIQNERNVPDGDYSDQALMILKKFFQPDTSFSLLIHVPDTIRSNMLSALADAERPQCSASATTMNGDKAAHHHRRTRSSPPTIPLYKQHQLYLEAQRWAEGDIKVGSFRSFCSSKICARMTGHLRYSPPFVKISLSELLSCDKKSVFLLLYLCQVKRY